MERLYFLSTEKNILNKLRTYFTFSDSPHLRSKKIFLELQPISLGMEGKGGFNGRYNIKFLTHFCDF